jgi:hypothetical protein
MKIKSLFAATAAVIMSSSALADSYLYPVAGETYQGVVPVGIIVNDSLKSALQTAQLGAECAGEATTACMPSLSSVELASIISTNGGQNWDDFGLPAFAGGAAGYGNIVLTCGHPDTDDASAAVKGATKVATQEVGMGCSGGSFPTSKYNTVIGFATTQSDVTACTGIAAPYGLNLVSFAAASETLPSGFSMVKFNGTAPDIANVLSGDYSMFGDVHGDAISSPQFAAAGAGVPQHKLNLTSTSDSCAPGSATSIDISN